MALLREPPEAPRPGALERRWLGILAWSALREHCAGCAARGAGDTPYGEGPPEALRGEWGLLGRRVGVFVTLLSARALRGCVGSAAATEPLWLAVKRLAIKAASADPRFPPVEEAELPSLEVEITCLGALVDVPGSFPLERLRPEEHGVWLRLRGRSGLLLPQVARRQGWDLHELLDQVAVKAGLQPGAWRERGARLQAFTAWSFTAPAPPDGGGGGGSG